MICFGNVPASSVLPIFFDAFSGSTGASITISGLAVTDIEVYKGTSMTQRASDNGYALIDTDGIDLDGITGIHGFSIDLSDNSDAGFYAAGSFYTVVVSAVTIDSQTVSFIAATFRIVAAEGSAGTPKADVSHFGGTAGTFASGRPEVNTTHFNGTAATASGGRPEVNTTHAAGTAWGSGAITAASIAADAITAAKVAADVGTEIGTAVWATTTRQLTGTQTFDLTGNITGSLSGSVGSVSGAVGSVTGNVGGNVTGSVGSVATGGISSASFAAGAINAAAIAADAIGASELAADAVTEIAGAVWDITLASHLTGGTTGNALNAAGSAGDPWSTALPGAYSAGSAGYIMGTNLNATVSSRLASASYTAPLDAAGVRTAVGLASANLDTQLDALPTATENADALLKRDWTSVTGEAARSVLNALRFLRNKWTASGGSLTVYKEDDTTTAWSGTVTTAASDPVSSIDPS